MKVKIHPINYSQLLLGIQLKLKAKIKDYKMKRFLPLLVLIGSTSFVPNAQNLIYTDHSVVEMECQHGQCQATAKSTGKRCKHCVSNSGDRYCFQHK